jgi:hypothetical protein
VFQTDAGLLSSDTDNADDIYMASLATGYPRPKGATPSSLPLVPAYTSCSSTNRVHGPPLSFGSCAPPAQTSGNLTAGTPDANGAGVNQTGYVRITPVVGAPGPPDDSDVSFRLELSDVRCKAGVSACGDPNATAGPDYAGELQGTFTTRITDKFNGGSSFTEPATVNDLPLAFTATCAITASTASGGACSAATSLNAITPGAIKDGAGQFSSSLKSRSETAAPTASSPPGPTTSTPWKECSRLEGARCLRISDPGRI